MPFVFDLSAAETAHGASPRAGRPAALVLGAALGAVLALLAPGRATAQCTVATLNTGTDFTSGARLGSFTGFYPPGTSFPVQFTRLATAGEFAMQIQSFFIPDVPFPFDEVFSFELLDDQGVPTDAVTLTLDLSTGAINPELTDPPLAVRMIRTRSGEPAGSEVFGLDLATGNVELPACGGAPGGTLSGVPLDVQTGAFELTGGACIEQFAGIGLGAHFELSLSGTVPGDADGDGVPPGLDNCLGLANSSQLDTNLDGHGNACDADYNDDGLIGAPDFLRLAAAFGSTVGDPEYDPELDADGDGAIGASEFFLLGRSMGGPPGPSAPACE
jgi:hypothetical protein